MIAFQKQPIFLLNGEVIWQASDAPLTKELHVLKDMNWIGIVKIWEYYPATFSLFCSLQASNNTVLTLEALTNRHDPIFPA